MNGSRGGFDRAFWLSWAGALATGTALRLYRLPAQMLVGDEIHAVRAVVSTPLPEILFRYGVTDHCLPLSGLARWLVDRGVELSEAGFRAPVVAAGVALLALLPLLARPVASRQAALVFPWWLALSPALVLYGRIARSYTPAALLALAAVAAFFAWWRGHGRRYAVLYVVLGALACYFLLVVAPFVAAPLAFGGLARIARRHGGGPEWGGLLLAGAGLAAGLAAFLAPGWEGFLAVVAEKQGQGTIRADTLAGGARLLAGSAGGLLALAFWLLAVRGWVVVARRDRELALLGALLVAVQAVGLWVLGPYGLAEPVVFSRYLLVALPVVLFWVAHGIVLPRPAWTGAAAALLLAALFATGPFATERFRTSTYVHHDDFLGYHRPLPALPEGRMPRFYERLAEEAGDGVVLEMPTYPEGTNRALHLYQDRHGRDVMESSPVPDLNDERLDFRNRAIPYPAPILASRARYLVVHRDLEAEELAVVLPPGVPRVWNERQQTLSARFRRMAANRIAALSGLWGPPEVDDGTIVVWDLDRVRARRAAAAKAASGPPS